MSAITITRTDTHITVSTPYDAQFPPQARSLGGRFNGATKTWQFDPRDETRVRDIVRTIYGTDGGDDQTGSCTIRIDVNTIIASVNRGEAAELRLAGRRIAWRPGRDTPVRLDDGVVLVSGGFCCSGGSTKYPDLAPEDGTVVEVRDLPSSVADKMIAESGGAASLVDGDRAYREALTDERARLVARIAEIDAQLGGAQ